MLSLLIKCTHLAPFALAHFRALLNTCSLPLLLVRFHTRARVSTPPRTPSSPLLFPPIFAKHCPLKLFVVLKISLVESKLCSNSSATFNSFNASAHSFMFMNVNANLFALAACKSFDSNLENFFSLSEIFSSVDVFTLVSMQLRERGV